MPFARPSAYATGNKSLIHDLRFAIELARGSRKIAEPFTFTVGH
jgi:hypothetical protein